MSSYDYGSYDVMLRGVQHANPMFDYMTTFIPRKLKAFFLYCEYLYHYCAAITAVVQKLAYYPVTQLRFETENPQERERHRALHEDVLNTRAQLIQAEINKQVYGNAFVSVHLPFQRMLTCPECSTRINARTAPDAMKYDWKTVSFSTKCACGYSGKFDIEDVALKDKHKIHVIHWDPKYIDIRDNPITGEAEYFFEIPGALSKRVQDGDEFLVRTLPLGFLETIKESKGNENQAIFKFDDGAIYHMKTSAPAGLDKCWGAPPMISAIKGYFHIAMLRKANEAIAMDFVVPLRVVSPKQSTGTNDPTLKLNLAGWVNQMEDAVKKWRRDPLHMMLSPIPTDVTHIGGQGRALMVTGELTQTENEILASMGVPREFIYGGLTSTGGGVTLRMIENQLLGTSKDLTKLAQWLDNQCSKYLSMASVKVRLEDPKLLDDVEQKMVVLKANEATGGQLLSNTAIADMFNRDLNKEREQRGQEALDETKFQMQTQNEIRKLQNTLSQQAEMATQSSLGGGLGYDPQMVTARAQEVAMQMLSMPDGMRRSQLDQLNKEDPVMYACTIQQLEVLRNEQQTQARAMVQEQGGM